MDAIEVQFIAAPPIQGKGDSATANRQAEGASTGQNTGEAISESQQIGPRQVQISKICHPNQEALLRGSLWA
jgi:hypothetical protein